MLLTITLTAAPTAPDPSDLGYLLHKHPDRVQHFDLPVGRAQVFYPEATAQRCTAALLVQVDPVGLVRHRRFGGDGFTLGQYVNDRPYAASSMLAVALSRVFGSALRGRCDARPELAGAALPLTIRVPAVPTPDGPELVRRLFGPLGWEVTARTAPLDPEIPRWGDAPYVDLELCGTQVLAEALRHLYVLLPVLDGAKHYWVGSDEVDKLIRRGEGWLATHPERDLITRRYLARQRSLVADATGRLAALDDSVDEAAVDDDQAVTAQSVAVTPERARPRPTRLLAAARRAAVLQTLRRVSAHRVADLGCGEGALLADLLADPGFTEILGVDVSSRALARAERRLGFDRLADHQRARISLVQSSATYRDARLAGWDAVVLSEVVEHLDPNRLPALEHSVFAHARPQSVIVTTPNADHNVLYPDLAAGAMRHPDHRFEFSRTEFAVWAQRVAGEFGYAAEVLPVGEVDARYGPATQMAVFSRDLADRSNTGEVPQ